MKAQKIHIALFMVVLGVAYILFMAGCAKKEVVKEEPAAQPQAAVEQAPAQPSPDAEKEKAMAEQAAREKAQAEEAARQKAQADEQAMAMARDKEAAAKMAGKAEAATEREASQFGNIYFDFDSDTLKQDARGTLNMYAKWLMAHQDYMVRIEGNCDERGSVEYNLALGQRRADSATKYLVDLGVDKNRISTVSYGKERPVDPGHDEEAWAKNRRDLFSVTTNK
jgi:peptidoglycan-associated lipoprotein